MTDPGREALQTNGLDAADAAASEWFVLRDRGFTPAEHVRFNRWRSESEDNAAAWGRAEQVWASFDAEPDLLLEGMRTQALRARPNLNPGLQRGLLAASVAAALVLVGVVGWRALPPLSERAYQEAAVSGAGSQQAYATAIGGRSVVALLDGSHVTLDSDSALTVAFTAARREVRLLRGQAFFAVAHDVRHPFMVAVAGRTVTDLGTAFDVRLDPEGISVILAQGSVVVAQADDAGRPVRLSPGQEFQAAPGRPGTVKRVDLNRALAWRSGYLEFKDEPLADAMAQMNRHGGTPVSVADPVLRRLRVSGRFRVGDPKRFARALAEVYPVRVVSRPGGGVALGKR